MSQQLIVLNVCGGLSDFVERGRKKSIIIVNKQIVFHYVNEYSHQ